MKAVILVGGKGKRLRPYTYVFPKPLLPINGKPILEIILTKLKNQGVNETLSSSEKEYMIDRFNKHREEREIRQEKREARNRVYAKEFAEKQMQKKKNLNG